jgi:hypothetical protein
VEGSGSTCPTLPHRHREAAGFGHNWSVGVHEDCRHYIMQTTAHEEKLERCRMGANDQLPFACPDGCLFYEPRKVTGAGWTIRNRDDPSL